MKKTGDSKTQVQVISAFFWDAFSRYRRKSICILCTSHFDRIKKLHPDCFGLCSWKTFSDIFLYIESNFSGCKRAFTMPLVSYSCFKWGLLTTLKLKVKPRKTFVILVKNEHLRIHKVEKSEKSCFRSSPKIVFLSFYLFDLFKGGIFKRLGKPFSKRRKNVKISHLLRLPFLSTYYN